MPPTYTSVLSGPIPSGRARLLRSRKGKRAAQLTATSRPPRKRGGQPGNTNRLIHGLYSSRLPREITAPPDPRTGIGLEFEISLARVRLVQLLDQQKKAPRRAWLTYERAVLNYIMLITSLIAAHTRRQKAGADVSSLLDSLRATDASPMGTDWADSNLIRTSQNSPGTTRD